NALSDPDQRNSLLYEWYLRDSAQVGKAQVFAHAIQALDLRVDPIRPRANGFPGASYWNPVLTIDNAFAALHSKLASCTPVIQYSGRFPDPNHRLLDGSPEFQIYQESFHELHNAIESRPTDWMEAIDAAGVEAAAGFVKMEAKYDGLNEWQQWHNALSDPQIVRIRGIDEPQPPVRINGKWFYFSTTDDTSGLPAPPPEFGTGERESIGADTGQASPDGKKATGVRPEAPVSIDPDIFLSLNWSYRCELLRQWGPDLTAIVNSPRNYALPRNMGSFFRVCGTSGAKIAKLLSDDPETSARMGKVRWKKIVLAFKRDNPFNNDPSTYVPDFAVPWIVDFVGKPQSNLRIVRIEDWDPAPAR
ncbi:MAG: hypothetical protein AAB425_09195, partial [Bdellovibrionota bacterium]